VVAGNPSGFSACAGLQELCFRARNAVGFYWTLPVPWAGLTSLPNEIDEAAKVSRTIRYQRDRIRRYATDEGYRLVHEELFLEIEPDRGSNLILEPLRKVKKICEAEHAVLLFVDFWEVQRWRAHWAMTNWLRQANIEMQSIAPSEIMMDGKIFDPHAHFRAWREKQLDWTQKKEERIVRARGRARELQKQGQSYLKIADTLNREQLPSLTGRPWTADNIGSFAANRSKQLCFCIFRSHMGLWPSDRRPLFINVVVCCKARRVHMGSCRGMEASRKRH
jgi:hypothetical protein